MDADAAAALSSRAMSSDDYESQVASLLFELLLEVLARHQPEIAPLLQGTVAASGLAPHLLGRALQAHGMWLQLLSIAEQNAAMRRRREARAVDPRRDYLRCRVAASQRWGCHSPSCHS